MKTSLKVVCAAVALCGASSVAAGSASAMPMAPTAPAGASALVQDVGWRCGPGWHMNGWGRCVPNGGPRYGWRRGWGWRRRYW